MNKTKAVLQHLEAGHGITNKEASDLFGTYRLSAIIFTLRQRGYNIVNVDRECIDRFGHRNYFVEYRLIKED